MIRVIRSENIYTLTDYGARVAVGIVDRKSPWPQDLNDDEKQALRRLQSDKYVIEDAKRMGIGQFLFNGGELTIGGEKWLDLVRLIAWTGHVAGVTSNGWWGIDEPFSGMGRRFDNAARFASVLRAAGISDIMFSLDRAREIQWNEKFHSG